MANIRVLSNLPELHRVAADEFVRHAKTAVSARGVFHVALSGGSTPKGLFALLAEDDARRQAVPWAQTLFWWGDERHVPPDHPDSNYKLAYDTMLARVPVPAQNIHRVHAEMPYATQAAREYQEEIYAVFGITPPTFPVFDLILLGMGPDAHTASLFPGTKALHETSRLVVENWVGKFFTWRITFTAALINRARAVMFLVAGDDKAIPLKGVLEGPYEPEQMPAQLIQPQSGNLLWLSDSKAAASLQSSLAA